MSVEFSVVIFHAVVEVGLAEILFVLFGSTSALALKQCLVVSAKSDLVWLDLMLVHVLVYFDQGVYLLAGSARFKQPAINELDVTHWLYLLPHVAQQLTSEVNQTVRMHTVDRKSRAEYLEPQQVKDLKVVSGPLVVVHFKQLIVRDQLAQDLLLH